jgi:hypothetical protein
MVGQQFVVHGLVAQEAVGQRDETQGTAAV